MVVVVSVISSGCAYIALVSETPAGLPGSGGASTLGPGAAVSSDGGRHLVFTSSASDLVANDTNGVEDVFVRDLATEITRRVSVDGSGGQLDARSFGASIDATGELITFFTDSTGIDGSPGLFLARLGAGSVERVDRRPDGSPPLVPSTPPAQVSGDGRFVAFASEDDGIVTGDANGVSDVFVRDLLGATTERISVGPSAGEADGASHSPSVSANGSVVAFASGASNLVTDDSAMCATADPSCPDVFVHTSTGIEKVSTDAAGLPGNGPATAPSVSGDGTVVAFLTLATNLTPEIPATPASGAVAVVDLATGDVAGVGPAPSDTTLAGNAAPSLSHDGSLIAVESSTALVANAPAGANAYIIEIGTGQAILATVAEIGAGVDPVSRPRLSPDGRLVIATTADGQVRAGASSQPTMDAVSPPTVAIGEPTSVTVSGTGFLPWTTLATGAPGVVVSDVTRVSPSELTATITATPGVATAGSRNLFVVAEGTGPGVMAGSADRCTDCLTVVDDRPNMLVVMLDDARPDEMDLVADLLPAGGFSWVRDNGVSFDRLFMTNNLCCPARAGLMTGQTSFNHGKRDNANWMDIPDGLSAWLHDAGYCTSFAGKWLNRTAAHRDVRPGGWDFWEPLLRDIDDEYGYTMQDDAGTEYAPGIFQTTHLGDRSRAHLASCLADGDPVFINYWPFPPHFGAHPSPTYADFPIPLIPNPNPAFNEADIGDKPAWLQLAEPEADEFAWLAAYWIGERRVRSLLDVDDVVRALIDDLDAAGELDDTVIVLVSDNGSLLGEHRIMDRKQLAYEAAQPTVWIAGPGFAPSTTSDAFIGNIDLTATLTELGRATPTRTLDGMSIIDVMASPDTGADRFFPIDVAGSVALVPHPPATGVRTSRYSYVVYESVPVETELYDLDVDPYQLTNVATDPAYAATVADLEALRLQAIACVGATCRAPTPAHLRSS